VVPDKSALWGAKMTSGLANQRSKFKLHPNNVTGGTKTDAGFPDPHHNPSTSHVDPRGLSPMHWYVYAKPVYIKRVVLVPSHGLEALSTPHHPILLLKAQLKIRTHILLTSDLPGRRSIRV
jgi:hypothetical protein